MTKELINLLRMAKGVFGEKVTVKVTDIRRDLITVQFSPLVVTFENNAENFMKVKELVEKTCWYSLETKPDHVKGLKVKGEHTFSMQTCGDT